MSPSATDDGEGLKRLGGGNWQTRDGRFTIESESGTWSLVDAEQTDDLGLPLVRGPFRSLTEAKAAIEEARSSAPATSALSNRAGTGAPRPTATGKRGGSPEDGSRPASNKPAEPKRPPQPDKPAEPEEPRWMTELEPADRRRARRLMDRLAARGVRDAEGVVRRDLAGDVPAVARTAVADRLAEALDGADPAAAKLAARIVELLAEGRDEDLDVRWRLVDEAGRPIGVSSDDVSAARKRAREEAR